MSSILEALKKLEEEKATRLGGAGNIAGKVIRSGRRPRQRPGWWLPAGMASAAVIAATATYLFTGGFFTADRPAPPVAPAPSSPPQAVALSPDVPTQAAQAVAVSPVRPASPPQLPAMAARGRAPVLSPRPPVVRPKPVVNVVPLQQTAEPKRAERPAPPPRITTPPQPAASPKHPKLMVTGIGWQKDGADRLAIVNGKAVSEGTTIEGAKVEEIFPDRVKFSVGVETFDVSLGKAAAETP